jgi:hypothetical protein
MDIEWQKRKVKSKYYVHFRIINVTNSIVVLLYMTIKEKNPTLIMY